MDRLIHRRGDVHPMPMTRKPDKPDSGGVQSLARAFALLECVAQAPNGLGLT